MVGLCFCERRHEMDLTADRRAVCPGVIAFLFWLLFEEAHLRLCSAGNGGLRFWVPLQAGL